MKTLAPDSVMQDCREQQDLLCCIHCWFQFQIVQSLEKSKAHMVGGIIQDFGGAVTIQLSNSEDSVVFYGSMKLKF